MKAKAVGNWICTVLIGLSFLSGGAAHLLRAPQVVEGITHLGYPVHFVTILGIWKVLGGAAVLLPGFALLKESQATTCVTSSSRWSWPCWRMA